VSIGDAKRAAIRAVYEQVAAPQWAAPNLDGLADVLRDLSWLAPGPVSVRWRPEPNLAGADRDAIAATLRAAARESAGSARPILLTGGDQPGDHAGDR
jgi:hypothetical protein